MNRAFCAKVLLPAVLATLTVSQAAAQETAQETATLDAATAVAGQGPSIVAAPTKTQGTPIRMDAEVSGCVEYDFTPNRIP